jgi:predicted membrane-bound spermidine synthase
MTRTEIRVAEREVISTQLRNIRNDIENEMRKRTGNQRFSLCQDLIKALYGDSVITQNKRSHLSMLESGKISFSALDVYKYMKALGFSDSKIKNEYLRIVKLCC